MRQSIRIFNRCIAVKQDLSVGQDLQDTLTANLKSVLGRTMIGPIFSNDLHCHSLQLPVAAIVNIKHCSQFLFHLLAERPAVV